jgi:hypothetical protein
VLSDKKMPKDSDKITRTWWGLGNRWPHLFCQRKGTWRTGEAGDADIAILQGNTRLFLCKFGMVGKTTGDVGFGGKLF